MFEKPSYEELEQKIRALEEFIDSQKNKETELLEEIEGLKQIKKYYYLHIWTILIKQMTT